MAIPKLLSQIWIGPLEPPHEWLQTWRDAHPDWDYRLWRDDDVDVLDMQNRTLYDRMVKARRYDGASDIVRAEILYQYGGVYVDADSECLRPITDAWFLERDFFIVQELQSTFPYLLNGAFMGAVPGHPLMARYIQELSKVRRLVPTWRTVGPVLITRVLTGGDIEVLPSWTFFPTTIQGEPITGGEPYARHFWSSTMEMSGSPVGRRWPT